MCIAGASQMIASISSERFELSIARKVLRLLEGLKRTEAGEAIFSHIEGLLEDSESSHADIEQAYARILDILLSTYAQYLPAGSSMQVQLKLIQMHLIPPMSASELITLRRSIEQYADKIAHSDSLNQSILETALLPLLEDFSIAKSAPSPPTLVPTKAAGDTRAPKKSHQSFESQSHIEQRMAPAFETGERRVDSAYRHHLSEKREGIQRIQDTLSRQITESIRQNEEFGVLLEVELEALRQASSIQEMDILRKTLINEVEKLLYAQQSMTNKLDGTHDYLQIVESDSQQLNDELTRVHLLSLTDDLTALPNRRAFMRRLEDEVGRVQRYGNPLSLILLDLDAFKSINDKHGHAGGDEVLRTYARRVLSIFRHHDLVARYGGEEFAVLLPNTDNAGAMAAITKVQKRAAETTFEINGHTIAVPTFSAGIALYKPGETPTDLIERADNALYHAKRLGRNRSEFALLEGSDAVIS